MNLSAFYVRITGIIAFGFFTIASSVNDNGLNNYFLADKVVMNLSSAGEWGPWTKSDCYKGLDYRIRHKKSTETYDGIKHIWGVQFRNGYQEKIFFGYNVYDRKPQEPGSLYRTELEPGELSSGYTDHYMSNDNSIYVYMEKVRFKKDDLRDYSDCDK